MLKKFLKLCSIVLSIVLLANMLPLQIYALELDATDTVKPVTGQTSQEVTVLGEITEKRTEYTKEFRLSNGLNLATVYTQPVHYEEDGQWKEIDNTLVATTAGFKNTSGVWDVTFPQNMRGSNSVTIQKDGHTLSFYMSGQLNVQDSAVVASTDAAETFALQPATESNAQVQKIDLSKELEQAQYPETVVTKNYSRLQYSGVFASTDIVYDLAANQVKESIIIQRADASLRGYRYALNTGDMVPVLEDSGEITLYDKDKKNVVMVMPAPFLQDSNGVRSYDVTVQLSGSDGAYTLSYILPSVWMQTEDRQYPIILDPIVEAGNNRDNTEDTTVFQYPPAYPDDYRGVLKIGKDPTWGIMRAYVKFLTLPEIADTDIIVEATFSAKVIGWFAEDMAACVHKVNGTWDAATINWENQPDIDTDIVQDFNVPEATDTTYKWDVTEIVRDWYLKENTGLVLRPLASLENKTVYGTYMVQLASEEYSIYSLPGLSIAYRSTVGVEPYFTYATFGAGNAGGVYLSDNSGQITAMRQVAGYASSVNPFSANLVYNSAYFVKNESLAYSPLQQMGLSMNAGIGWTLDLVQKIEPVTIGSTAYLRYYDGDGTVHYLQKSSGKYYDEDGLGLEVVANSDGSYTMSDAMDNTWKFTALSGIDGFFLTSSLDNNGNGYTLNYESGKLTSVVQNNRNQTGITVATFGYNADGYLTSVTDAAGDKYILSYASNKLTQIKWQYGSTTDLCATYGYANSRLTSMTDEISDYSLTFTYYSGSSTIDGGRVSAYWESYTDSSGAHTGVKCEITYPSYTQTIYHSYGMDRKKETPADNLHHIYLFDYAGRTVNAYTTDDSQNVLGASTAVYTDNDGIKKTNNRTERTATIGVPAQKYLHYGHFESGEGTWTLSRFVRGYDKKHNGYCSLTGTLYSTSYVATAQKESVALTAGQPYTISAYVRTAELEVAPGTTAAGNPNGIFLKVTTADGVPHISEPVDYATNADVDRGWVRICLTFTPTQTGAATVCIVGTGAEGTFYVDDVQLEAEEVPSNYNLLENGNMETPSFAWYQRDCISYVTGGISGKCMQITGDPADTQVNTYQTVSINRVGHQSFVFSGWAKADAVTDNVTKRGDPAYDNTKQFGLRAKVTYCTDPNGDLTEYYYVPFNPDVSEWQYASLTITPKQTEVAIDRITVTCVYECNANIAWFDELSLVSKTVEQMEYNKDTGKLVNSVSTGLNGQTTTYDSNGNVASVTTRTGSGSTDKIVYTYTYDSTFVHRMVTSTNGFTKETYSYDEVGNVTGTVLSAVNSSSSKTISSGAAYTNGGNLIASSTDSAGNTTSYAYTGDRYKVYGQPSAVTDAKGTSTTYILDGYGRTQKVSLENIANIQYAYSKNLLTGLTRTAGNASQVYSFAYDDFGNSTTIKVGTGDSACTLAAYTYGDKNGLLTGQEYGNGDAVSYTYDILGRVKTAEYFKNDSSRQVYRTLTYTYTGDGELYRITDSKTGYTYIYNYDSIGRLNTSIVKDRDGNTLLQTRQIYNANDQLTAQQWIVEGTTYTQAFTYSKRKGSLTSMTPGNGDTLSLDYDDLQRLSKVDSSLLDRYYTHRDISATQTTGQVSSYQYKDNLGVVRYSYGYTYDQLGNIATYTDNGTTYTYTYDAQNQLTQQTGGGITYTYTYDAAGNILSAVATDGTEANTISHSYSYGYNDHDQDNLDDDVWKDLLLFFDEQPITYDASGNPTSYYNGTKWRFAWAEGRNLVSADKIGPDNEILATYTYAYDQNGVRTQKTVGGVTHNYLYASGKLLRETWGDNTLDFFYGENGHPYALKYNGTTYYYVTNLQGDVLAILDGSKQVVASYTYDPYGKVLTATGTLAEVNPLRYRGYFYDQDAGFYYLQSRYYDPTTCRFINADSYASTGQGLLGHNMFVYCLSNPIMFVDTKGTDAIVLYDEDAVGHIGLLVQDSDGTWWHFYWGTEGGKGGSFNRVSCAIGISVDPYSWCVEYTGENLSLTDINSANQYGGQYEEMYYLVGDFSDSLAILMEPSGQYNLYTNNCSQYSLKTLAISDTVYRKLLREASEYILPKKANQHLSNELAHYGWRGNGFASPNKTVTAIK